MKSGKYSFLLVGLLVLGNSALARDFLDPPYPKVEAAFESLSITQRVLLELPKSSNSLKVISAMTPVKDQDERGTCSIFSSIALLEGLLKITGLPGTERGAVDLSEEWLEYTVVRKSYTDGSTSPANFKSFQSYGAVQESIMPYIGETWTLRSKTGLPAKRCGQVPKNLLRQCLLGHYDPRYLEASDEDLKRLDPQFLRARDQAKRIQPVLAAQFKSGFIKSEAQVKAFLAAGIPLALDLDFFYGAWNHGDAPKYGISRDEAGYRRGLVGFPEPGSMDFSKSLSHPAGHSVVAVGYDDDYIIKTRQKMADGSVKTFTYKGVYFFKNSWGADHWGSQSVIQGYKVPGYGAITQAYAHQYGQFFAFAPKQ